MAIHFNPSVHLRELLRKENDNDASFDFQALVVSVAQSALILIFQGKPIQGSDRCGYFMFPRALSVETTSIVVSKKLLPHFFTPTNASFSGSYLFAALHVTPSLIADSTFSQLEAAFKKPDVPFYQRQNRYVRLEDRWVDFNHLEGLKFFIALPFYIEIRAHQRDPKLLDLQTVEIETLGRQIQSDRSKQLQLTDTISELKAQKTDLEKRKQDSSALQQKIISLEAELAKMKEALKKKLEEYSKLVQTPPVHAATGPVLRALAERSITQYQEAGEQLATALESTRKLGSQYLQAEEGFLHETQSLPLRNRQMDFFKQWVLFLQTNYIHIAPVFTGSSKTAVAKENLGIVQEHLEVLAQSLLLLDQFEAQSKNFPRAAHFLSNARNNFRSQVLQEIQRREKALSSFILGAMGELLRLDPIKYLTDALLYYYEMRTIFDMRLKELGRIDPRKEKAEKYLAPLDYANERALLDDQIHLLSFIAFTSILATELAHPLLPVVQEEIIITPPKPPALSILQTKAPELFSPIAGKIQRVLDTYKAFEESIPSSDVKTLQQKWVQCKQAITSLEQDLPKVPQPFAGSYDTTLAQLLQALPATMAAERKKVTDLKKELKNSEDLLKIGELAVSLSSLPQNTLQTTALLDHLRVRSLLFLSSALSDFPKLQLNQWVLKRHEQQLSIRDHLHWPSDKTDPYYMANETHIPV